MHKFRQRGKINIVHIVCLMTLTERVADPTPSHASCLLAVVTQSSIAQGVHPSTNSYSDDILLWGTSHVSMVSRLCNIVTVLSLPYGWHLINSQDVRRKTICIWYVLKFRLQSTDLQYLSPAFRWKGFQLLPHPGLDLFKNWNTNLNASTKHRRSSMTIWTIDYWLWTILYVQPLRVIWLQCMAQWSK